MSLVVRVLLVLAALSWTTLVGWSVTRLFSHGLSRSETAAWSLAAGLTVQACLFALLLALGLIPGPKKLGLLDLLVVGACLAARPFRPPERSTPVRHGAWLLLLLLPAAAAFAVSTLDFLAQPMWATDAIAIWGLKAKTIFLTASIPRRLFSDPAMLWSHPEYPLLVPVSLASLAAFLRSFDDQALALLDAALEAATILAAFGFLRRRVSALAGVAAATLIACCFFLYRDANAGTAEIPFALALLLLSTALLDLEESDGGAVRARLVAASFLCVTSKQEGTLFVALSLALIALRRLRGWRVPSVRAAAICLLPAAVLQMAVTRLLAGGTGHRDYDLGLLSPARLAEWMPRVRAVFSHLVRVEIAGAAVALAAVAVFFLLTRPTAADRLLPVLLLQVCAYATAATLSWWGAVWALETSFARITMTLFPAFALVLGARMGDAVERSRTPCARPLA